MEKKKLKKISRFIFLTFFFCTTTINSDTYGLAKEANNIVSGTKMFDEMKTPSDNLNLTKQSVRQSGTELLEERTLFSKRFLQSDGKIREDFSLVPVHYLDETGKYQDINTKLTKNSEVNAIPETVSKDTHLKKLELANSKNYSSNTKKNRSLNASSFTAFQVPFSVDIPNDISMGYTIGKDKESITITPLGGTSSLGALDKESAIVYKDVWQDSDIELVVTNIGIKENIILHSKEAPDTFKFQIQQSSSNLKNLIMMPSYLYDSNKTYREIETKMKDNELTISYDDTGLVYPITIDPTTTILPVRAQYVDPNNANQSYTWEPVMKVGIVSQYYQYYSYLKFDLTDSIRKAQINSASLQLFAPSITAGTSTVTTYALNQTLPDIGVTYNSRPVFNNSIKGSSVNITTANQFYTFDVTSIVKNDLLTKSTVSMGLSGSGRMEFTTPWSGDPNKFPKLSIVYNGIASPIVSEAKATMVDENSVRLNWTVNEVNGLTQTQFEAVKFTYSKKSLTYFQASKVTGFSSKYVDFNKLSSGGYYFAVRSYNGSAWSEWTYSNYVEIDNKNKYDASNRLKSMEYPDGSIVEFTYDNNGNMLKKIPIFNTTNLSKSIADGNPIEWTYNKYTFIYDNPNDFINTELDTQEPERDIRGVYYNTDSTYLYVMIELGGTKEYELLNPHGYDNDNYFIYLSSPKVGSGFTRNNTPLPREVSFEIGSWHNDDVTIHSYDPKTKLWKWDWSGDYSNDGYQSVKVMKENPARNVYTSAILELRIPLKNLPEVDLSSMIVVAGSDKYDMDIAY
ncbi:YD repeat-containing protein [Paenibacillus sp. PastF-3]|uniref:CBM96 family carbohydrate-binding protein n=1 Tax=Paenibacillus sp. PastF-3 TaxID=2940626 RepID=UPI0024771DC5|nr:DNRLRE domain-containing protein [Paenibacillus sp. PastF-3]MDH6373791.1 YD repeat-containing protein [Paenibacillus sp. PastF-3]